MIIDSTLEMCNAEQITFTANTTTLIGSQIDTSVVRDIGAGRPMYLVISVDTAFAAGNGIQFRLVSDAQAAIAVDGTESRHYTSEEFVAADLTAGKTIVIPLPSGTAEPYEQYLGLSHTNGITTAFTAGKINAFLTFDPFGWKGYADAQN